MSNEKKEKEAIQIKINCTGHKNLLLKDIVKLQGNLKELSQVNYAKLKHSILKHGFSFPLNICTIAGKNFGVIDGHQRHRVIEEMIKEGFKLPGGRLPCTFTEAKDKKEAGELILQAVSQYGKLTDDGLAEFNSEFDIRLEDLAEVDFPDFDTNEFIESFGGGTPEAPPEDSGNDSGTGQTFINATCPECGKVFEVKAKED